MRAKPRVRVRGRVVRFRVRVTRKGWATESEVCETYMIFDTLFERVGRRRKQRRRAKDRQTGKHTDGKRSSAKNSHAIAVQL